MAPVTVTSSCVFFSFKQETLALAVKMPRPCLASLCFVLVSFPRSLPIWIPSLTCIPQVIISFAILIDSYLLLPPRSSVVFRYQLNSGPVLSCQQPPSSSLLSASVHVTFMLAYETSYPSLE